MFKGHKNYYILNLPNRAGIVGEIMTKCLKQSDLVTSFEYKKKSHKE